MNRGMIYALSAYIFWGLHPVYWKLLINVPSGEILAHRIIWSFLFLVIIVSCRKEWPNLIYKFRKSNNKFSFIAPAVLIGTNWGMYVWAVNAGHILETSLGYFISPLLSVFLGTFFLVEKLSRLQWIAIGIATLGVVTTTVLVGIFPWIALYLAGSWSVYGLLRKKSSLNSNEGLTLDTAFLSIFSIIYIGYLSFTGTGSFALDIRTSALLMGSGIISGLPLLVFIAGARMVNLSTIGMLQYIYPTFLFLLGIYVYNEPINEAKILGFVFIWIALILYSLDSLLIFNRKRTVSEAD
jgi:chloramphenicol-sensitive protein RarD